MAKRAFNSSAFNKPYHGPTSAGGSFGHYTPARILSPAQFHHTTTRNVRERITIGGLRINVTGGGARFTVGGAGYRFSSVGRITHITNIRTD